MKKIAIVITRMIPGGASSVARQIIDGLKDEFDFTLFSGIEDIYAEERDELEKKYKTVFVPFLVRQISPLNDIRAYLDMKRQFRAGDFDIVHTHTSKAGLIGRLAARHSGVKRIVHSTHGSIYQAGSKIPGVPDIGGYKRILLGAERMLSSITDYQTVLSQAEYDLSISLGLSRPENTIVIPNGVRLEDFVRSAENRVGIRKELRFSENEKIILCVGRLSSEKGQAVLIDAFRKLLANLPSLKARLVFLGDGPERKLLETKAESLLKEGKIIFFGHSSEPRKYLAAADIFVLPSMYEGFGIALVEAMAAGLPCVASAVGGIPEIIEDGVNGLLFKKGDSDGLKDKLILIVKNPAMAEEMAEKGKLSVKKYDLELILSQFSKIYNH